MKSTVRIDGPMIENRRLQSAQRTVAILATQTVLAPSRFLTVWMDKTFGAASAVHVGPRRAFKALVCPKRPTSDCLAAGKTSAFATQRCIVLPKTLGTRVGEASRPSDLCTNTNKPNTPSRTKAQDDHTNLATFTRSPHPPPKGSLASTAFPRPHHTTPLRLPLAVSPQLCPVTCCPSRHSERDHEARPQKHAQMHTTSWPRGQVTDEERTPLS